MESEKREELQEQEQVHDQLLNGIKYPIDKSN
jgi:hypothetical protein